MSTKIEIRENERGMVRVFATDLTREEIDGFDVANALGATSVDRAQVELFDVTDLQGLGLTAYLEEGHGIPPEQLKAMTGQLDGLKNVVLVVPSRTFGDQKQTLTPSPRLRLVGTFFEDAQPISFETLPSETAQGNVNTQSKSTPSNAAISGRVAMFALIFLTLLVSLMVWIAG